MESGDEVDGKADSPGDNPDVSAMDQGTAINCVVLKRTYPLSLIKPQIYEYIRKETSFL